MTDIQKDIVKLSEQWHDLISGDHHKDKDCHWYIETKWSYGFPPKYFVQHWGYILGDIQEEFDSYEDALLGLKEILIEKIEEEKNHKEEDNENEW